jgi:hypothetical protein
MIDEIEKAIEVFESEKKCWERECCDCKAENKGCYLSTTDFIYAEARDVALQVLRSQLTREKNEPLTLEELKGMERSPIWTITKGVNGSGRWELFEFTTLRICPLKKVLTLINLDEGATDYDIETYAKTWFAYRKPNK